MPGENPTPPAPAVSVIIPTYNAPDLLLETLASVFAQTFNDYEVLVVNDGSTDDTATRLRPLADAGRIVYIEQPNAGQSAARNHGLARARGEFIAFLDHDDLWPPDKLAWQVEALRAVESAGVVYGQCQDLGDGALHPGEDAPAGDVFAAFAGQAWIRSPGQVVIRRSVLMEAGGLDANIWGTEDWDLWLRLARRTRFLYRAWPALIYRWHANNSSKNFFRMWQNGRAVVRKIFGDASDPEAGRLRRLARRFVDGFAANDGFVRAYQLMETGRLRDAAAALLQVGRIRGWHGPDGLTVRAWLRLARLSLGGRVRR